MQIFQLRSCHECPYFLSLTLGFLLLAIQFVVCILYLFEFCSPVRVWSDQNENLSHMEKKPYQYSFFENDLVHSLNKYSHQLVASWFYHFSVSWTLDLDHIFQLVWTHTWVNHLFLHAFLQKSCDLLELVNNHCLKTLHWMFIDQVFSFDWPTFELAR